MSQDQLRSALSAMMTYFGMDEDEWSKPVFDQARSALATQQATQGAEPVAEVCPGFDIRWIGSEPIAFILARHRIKVGAKLYTATPPTAEVENDVDVSAYSLLVSDRPYADEIRIERARQLEGPPMWAVRLNGNCLNQQGEWEWEPRPSSRDAQFLARCRFDTAKAAIAAAREALAALQPNQARAGKGE